MIRDAKLEDIPRMVEMGQHFRKGTSYDKYLRDNPERMGELGRQLIEKNSLLVAEREGNVIGMLGYIVYDHFISGDRIAGEVFWWVEPEYRGDGPRLLREMKLRAKQAGAKFYQMIAPTAKVGKFYERLGCSYVEETWQGTL